MVVTCIDDDFSESESDIVKAILTVGDDLLLPKKNKNYEVIGFGNLYGKERYELAEIDTTKHGYQKRLLFEKRRFMICNDSFVPNAVLTGPDNLGGSGLCRKVNFYGYFYLNDNK